MLSEPLLQDTELVDLLDEISHDSLNHVIRVPRRVGTTTAFQALDKRIEDVTYTINRDSLGVTEKLTWTDGKFILAYCGYDELMFDSLENVVEHDLRITAI